VRAAAAGAVDAGSASATRGLRRLPLSFDQAVEDSLALVPAAGSACDIGGAKVDATSAASAARCTFLCHHSRTAFTG